MGTCVYVVFVFTCVCVCVCVRRRGGEEGVPMQVGLGGVYCVYGMLDGVYVCTYVNMWYVCLCRCVHVFMCICMWCVS